MSFSNIQAQLEAEFQNIQNSFNGSAGSEINLNRSAAFQKFKDLGIPTPKNEDWKYSNLKNLDKSEFIFPKTAKDVDKKAFFPAILGQKITFVNGIFSEKLTKLDADSAIEIVKLSDAQKSDDESLIALFAKHVDIDKQGLAAANAALSSEGVIIKINKNKSAEKPLTLHFISDLSENNIALNLHNLILAEENSEIKIVEIFESKGDHKGFENIVTEIFVEKNARVDYYKIQDLSDSTTHVGLTQVYQEEKSYFYAATISINGGFIRNDLNLILDGEHIESHMYGLYIPNGNQHIDNHTLVDHSKPNCESNELYKGILADKSTGVFNGKIFVRQDAQKTNAYQNCRNVLTSESASMNTKPQLEIWADDVKCSHGTTTGKLNDEAIFYMQSRGIPKADAIKLQLIAFAEDVVSQLKIEELREILDQRIEQKLQ